MSGSIRLKHQVQIIQGMTLPQLLRVLARSGFRVDTECFSRLAYLLVFGVFNSVLGFAETFFNMREIQATQIEAPPLFILGHWRSGTTHLHNLLNLDENFCAPTAYQATFPKHFVFSQAGGIVFNLLAPPKRPMDNVTFGSDVPHEDEFALAASSGVSPYLRVWFPVSPDTAFSELDPQCLPKEALQRWKDALILFVKKVSLSEGKRIVLKSPPHTGRVGTILEMFPEAQFIHIVRDPYIVYLSTHKLWEKTMGPSHLQIPEPELVDESILSGYTELFRLFRRDKHLIPEGALYEMKFEDLESDPMGTLEKAYKALGLGGFDRFSKTVETYLKSIKGYKKNEYRLDDLGREKVRTRWRRTFEEYGYPL